MSHSGLLPIFLNGTGEMKQNNIQDLSDCSPRPYASVHKAPDLLILHRGCIWHPDTCCLCAAAESHPAPCCSLCCSRSTARCCLRSQGPHHSGCWMLHYRRTILMQRPLLTPEALTLLLLLNPLGPPAVHRLSIQPQN